MNKKAIIFTIDASLAVLVAFIIISSAYVFLNSIETGNYNRQNLNKISIDSLAILEKDYTLYRAVKSSSNTEITNFLNLLPPQICGNITIFDQNFNPTISSQRSDCTLDQPTFSRRIFITSNYSTYYAESKFAFK